MKNRLLPCMALYCMGVMCSNPGGGTSQYFFTLIFFFSRCGERLHREKEKPTMMAYENPQALFMNAPKNFPPHTCVCVCGPCYLHDVLGFLSFLCLGPGSFSSCPGLYYDFSNHCAGGACSPCLGPLHI